MATLQRYAPKQERKKKTGSPKKETGSRPDGECGTGPTARLPAGPLRTTAGAFDHGPEVRASNHITAPFFEWSVWPRNPSPWRPKPKANAKAATDHDLLDDVRDDGTSVAAARAQKAADGEAARAAEAARSAQSAKDLASMKTDMKARTDDGDGTQF